MKNSVLHVQEFTSSKTQPLRNVPIDMPTIMWVVKGSKDLWWHEDLIKFNSKDWLAVQANQHLTFVNNPEDSQFQSKIISFLIPPPEELMQKDRPGQHFRQPRVQRNGALDFCFETFCSPSFHKLSYQAQSHFLHGFYAELAKQGCLPLLFASNTTSYREKISRYLGNNPGSEHKLEKVAQEFSISRATLVRKLSIENTSFSQLISEVRMGFALSLLQKSKHPTDVALACGYKSEARFVARFKKQFGLTPRQYTMTL